MLEQVQEASEVSLSSQKDDPTSTVCIRPWGERMVDNEVT